MILEKKRDVLIHSFTALKLIIHSCCCRCPFEMGFVILPVAPARRGPSAMRRALPKSRHCPALSIAIIAAPLVFGTGVIALLDLSPCLKRAKGTAPLGPRSLLVARRPLGCPLAASY